MKCTFLLYFIFLFGFFSGQNTQEFIFKFNVKKWNKELQTQQKLGKNETFTINLFDAYGKSVLFKLTEKSISEVAIPNLKIFKGKSADDQKIISLTVLPNSLSGSYLQHGVQYFIEPIRGSCNRYKVYTSPPINKEVEVGQINDVLK